MRGREGRVLFHLVSLSFANFPGRGVVVLLFVGGCVFGFASCCFSRLPGELLHLIRFQFHSNFQ